MLRQSVIAGGLALGGLLLAAAPAAAQHYGGYQGRSYHSGTVSQYDRPGDYRCDQYWDANRDDCGAAWRDQRRHHGWTPRTYRYGRYGYNWGHQAGSATYEGAYGRPDHVYPGSGYRPRTYSSGYGHGGYSHGGYQGARDPHRVEWCRRSYRSYDPHSGFYRAYSGRLVFCG